MNIINFIHPTSKKYNATSFTYWWIISTVLLGASCSIMTLWYLQAQQQIFEHQEKTIAQEQRKKSSHTEQQELEEAQKERDLLKIVYDRYSQAQKTTDVQKKFITLVHGIIANSPASLTSFTLTQTQFEVLVRASHLAAIDTICKELVKQITAKQVTVAQLQQKEGIINATIKGYL